MVTVESPMSSYADGNDNVVIDQPTMISLFQRQHEQNEGRCGICGDAFDAQTRPHEAPGGEFASTGIIVADYQVRSAHTDTCFWQNS